MLNASKRSSSEFEYPRQVSRVLLASQVILMSPLFNRSTMRSGLFARELSAYWIFAYKGKFSGNVPGYRLRIPFIF